MTLFLICPVSSDFLKGTWHNMQHKSEGSNSLETNYEEIRDLKLLHTAVYYIFISFRIIDMVMAITSCVVMCLK